ncbi:hypothetical protein JB92DRAFT_2833866 [Gautieria morchelliformis]|nr:hypothetical protein JB92DRAFT_2833866 [Gautieria morchelliformis]
MNEDSKKKNLPPLCLQVHEDTCQSRKEQASMKYSHVKRPQSALSDSTFCAAATMGNADETGTSQPKRQAAKKVQFADMMELASDEEDFQPETISEAESNELSDGSESEEPVDVIHKQVKDEPKIVLHVPDCTKAEGFIECVKIPASARFDDVEEHISKPLGATKLAYRLKGVHDKHLSKLAKEDDWATLKDDMTSAQKKKKKGDASGIEVEIVLDEDYMASLRHTLSGKKGKTVANTGGRGRKKREARIQDLNADSDADSGSDIKEGGQLTKREKDYMEALKAEYSNCGKSTCILNVCKLTKNGEHAHLSWNQLQSWVAALASEMHGVTLKNPPNNSHFRDFHYRKEENSMPKEKFEETPMQNMPGHAALGVQGSFPIMHFPGFVPPYDYRVFGQNIRPVHPATPPNSGKSEPIPATPGGIDFPSMNEFCEEFLNELKDVAVDTIMANIGLSWGDANSITRAVRKAIRNFVKE